MFIFLLLYSDCISFVLLLFVIVLYFVVLNKEEWERWLKGVKRDATTSSTEAECSKAVRAEYTAITGQDDYATTSSSTVSKAKNRKYDDTVSDLLIPTAHLSVFYVVNCFLIVPMAPAKLRRHLETVHPSLKTRIKNFLYVKKNSYWKVKKL